MGEIMTFEPTEAQFGVFWKYLQRPNVTDVDYNGSELWITDLKIGRYRVKEHLSDAFISTFTHNISNCVNRQFNNANKCWRLIPENCVSVLSMRRRPHPAPVSVSGSRRAWCA